MFYSKPKKALLKSSECVDACVSDSSCATGEKCCKTSCGGRACHDLRLAAKKYRSENKCRKADEFMMCIYANVAQRVSDHEYLETRRVLWSPLRRHLPGPAASSWL